jgi:hypothetical protein
VDNEKQASAETTSDAPASAAAGPPPPVNTGAENVAVYVRDWGYRGGGRFLRHGPRGANADPALNLEQDRCLGFVCRYRRDPKQPLGPGNEGILVTLHTASLSKAQAALRRLDLPRDLDGIDVTVLHFATPQVGYGYRGRASLALSTTRKKLQGVRMSPRRADRCRRGRIIGLG